MEPDRFNGKKVIDSEGRIVGEIAGLDIDTESLKVVKICINLSDDVIEKLGYEKKFLGKVQIDLPIEAVNSIKDVAILDKSISEMKEIIEPSE